MKHLTQRKIVQAASLIQGCLNGQTVKWAVNGEEVLTGRLRCIERTNRVTGERAASDDIRDQFVHITATFGMAPKPRRTTRTYDYWLKVGDVLKMMSDGLFCIEKIA